LFPAQGELDFGTTRMEGTAGGQLKRGRWVSFQLRRPEGVRGVRERHGVEEGGGIRV